MLPSMMNKPFTRKRYPVATDHGAQTTDYTGTPVTDTFRGSVQPGTGTTDTLNRNGAEVVYTILARPNADVTDRDQVTLGDGTTYFVNGEPERWAAGIMDHIVIHLSKWIG